ncbi:Mut7-C RNAse domain-containing protein [Pontibacter roseus]|uniref:Mut7-C RNAse domain-containing protein n=1 Tax=Pontibacter roseus TaxID=336989 RepID=UPI000374A6C2|nr:Mut7-C RNAse domain-containing protein [Pontibacter roseus]
MSHTASFHFHGSLNDFLRAPRRDTSFDYTFAGSPAVKDTIEAIGVPHLEIREVRANGNSVSLSYKLQDKDEVQVYPFDGKEEELAAGIAAYRFVLDVHLGTLARSLRLLGFDTVYHNNLTDAEISGIAEEERRIVLTRDVNLLKHKAIPAGYWLRSQHTEEQLAEVVKRFRLLKQLKPFSRCLVCNGEILEVPKVDVLEQLPPKTRLYFDEFFQCSTCRRVYWKGSHYERMQALVSRLEQDLK